VGRLFAHQRRQPQHRVGEVSIDAQDRQGEAARFLGRGVRGVPLLPQELGGAQEGPRALLPPHDVGPLVEQQRQIAVAADPAPQRRPDHRLRRRPHDQRLLQPLAAPVGDDRQLRREPLDVLRLTRDEALRNEQGEVRVLDSQSLEARVEVALAQFPDQVTVRPQDPAAPHGRLIDQVGGRERVLVPLGVVHGARCDRALRPLRFDHTPQYTGGPRPFWIADFGFAIAPRHPRCATAHCAGLPAAPSLRYCPRRSAAPSL
jgi:hypothetical protein